MILNLSHREDSAMASESEVNGDCVDVIIPLGARYASMLRVVTASLGVDAGFSIDEIDDFKLAVSEVFSMLVAEGSVADGSVADGSVAEGHHGGRARASFRLEQATMSVALSLESGARVNVQPDELALTILKAVVDSYDIGESAVTLAKGAIETSALSG